jgi:hypothetical protein
MNGPPAAGAPPRFPSRRHNRPDADTGRPGADATAIVGRATSAVDELADAVGNAVANLNRSSVVPVSPAARFTPIGVGDQIADQIESERLMMEGRR